MDMDMSTGWWIVAVVVMVVMMGGMLWMMVGMGSRSDRVSGSANDPLEIVRQRYARGEISEEEYQRVRRGLEGKASDSRS